MSRYGTTRYETGMEQVLQGMDWYDHGISSMRLI